MVQHEVFIHKDFVQGRHDFNKIPCSETVLQASLSGCWSHEQVNIVHHVICMCIALAEVNCGETSNWDHLFSLCNDE